MCKYKKNYPHLYTTKRATYVKQIVKKVYVHKLQNLRQKSYIGCMAFQVEKKICMVLFKGHIYMAANSQIEIFTQLY